MGHITWKTPGCKECSRGPYLFVPTINDYLTCSGRLPTYIHADTRKGSLISMHQPRPAFPCTCRRHDPKRSYTDAFALVSSHTTHTSLEPIPGSNSFWIAPTLSSNRLPSYGPRPPPCLLSSHRHPTMRSPPSTFSAVHEAPSEAHLTFPLAAANLYLRLTESQTGTPHTVTFPRHFCYPYRVERSR